MRKQILVLSAYHAQSHDYWFQNLIGALDDEFELVLLALPARYYAWRVGGNALSLVQLYKSAGLQEHSFDAVLATSMTDVASLKGLLPELSQLPWLLYCHENQFVYPKSEAEGHQAAVNDQNRVIAQMRHIYSVLASDVVIFNSEFNRTSFIDGSQTLMKKMPDFNQYTLDESALLTLGVPLSQDIFKRQSLMAHKTGQSQDPIRIAWAARWEFDKGLPLLRAIASELRQRCLAIEWVILGQQFRKTHADMQAFLDENQSDIIHAGFVDSREQYLDFLQGSDVILSTANHEFYGVAVLEAVALGCLPVLPSHQVYPELFENSHLYSQNNARQAADLIEHMAKASFDKTGIEKYCFAALDAKANQLLLDRYRELLSSVCA